MQGVVSPRGFFDGGDGSVKGFMQNMWKNRAHVIMALPAFLVLFFIMYVPMAGLVMAFKAFDYSKGIFGSPWNGIENFKFLLASKSTFINMTRNTVLYYLLFTSVGTVLNVALAIAIDNLVLKRMAKTMQTLMIIPVFISYAAVQFIVYAFISSDTGLINNALGLNIKFYSVAKLWPWILLITKIWKDTGYGSVLYMSVLSGIDTSLYEAATVDGAGFWDKLFRITLPMVRPSLTVSTVLNIIYVFNSFPIVYTMTKGAPANKTDTMITYLYMLSFYERKKGPATAMSVIGFLILCLCAGIYMMTVMRKEDEQ